MAGTDATRTEMDHLADATRLVRALTGMEIAYVSRFERGAQVVTLADGDVADTPLRTGLRMPLEETVCQRVVDGRLPRAIPDATGLPEAARLMAPANVRAYVGVPLRSREGALLGTLCGLSRQAQPDLDAFHVAALESLAPLVADHLVLAELEERERRRTGALVDAIRREVRAPAMAIRFLAEDLDQGLVAAAEAGATISAEVTRLLAALAAATAVEPARAALPRRTQVDLVVLCAATVADLTPDGSPVHLELPGGPLLAEIDPAVVGPAIGTLVDGALQRARRDPVVVELREEGPTAVVLVHDDADADADTDLRVVGAPGDVDPALAAGIRGLGYGLAAVQAAAGAHEGTLHLSARPGGGSTAALRLPRAASARLVA